LAAVDFEFVIRRTVEARFQFKEENEMKYILLIYDNEREWDKLSQAEQRDIYGQYGKFTESIKASGHYIGGSQLQPTTTARSVKVKEGKELITDGPFAETHEQLGGYYLIEAASPQEAAQIAARVPSAKFGTIEVRPLVEMPAQASA
jgi:hypothetical protein